MVGIAADLCCLSLGIYGLATNNVIGGAFFVFLGVFLLVCEAVFIAQRRGRAGTTALVFAVSFFLVIPAWVAIISGIAVATGGSITLAAVGFALAAALFFFDVRIFYRWLRAK